MMANDASGNDAAAVNEAQKEADLEKLLHFISDNLKNIVIVPMIVQIFPKII